MWWALGVVLVAVWVVWIGGCLGQWVFGCWFGLVFGRIDGGGSGLDFWWGFRWLWVVIWRQWVSILSQWVGIWVGVVGWFNFGDWLVVMVLELWW